jgi:nanoRNase/pAp phosphatase (c-di-AMP/oligoRNAs hydrolase)
VFRFDLQKITFLGIEVNTFNFASDMGIILCKLGVKSGHSNLAMMYRSDKGPNVYRVSFRSIHEEPEPLALKMALYFGGGGHLCAAGCKISKARFNSNFKHSHFGNWKF